MKAKQSLKVNYGRFRSGILALFLTVATFCITQSTNAQSTAAGDVVVTLKEQKVHRAPDGKEVLKVAERAIPGEVIQYDAFYKNQGKKGIRNLEPTLPIPRGLEYVPDSAQPAPAKASLDGKNFAPIPLKRQVSMPDGQTREE